MLGIFIVLIIAAAAILAECMVLWHLRRKRAFARLEVQACPVCSRIYGPDILSTMKETGYSWDPAPGYSASSLELPRGTFLVTCPTCSVKTEFTQAGFVFRRPKEGVTSFRRVVRA
jgi:hypothetical protein